VSWRGVGQLSCGVRQASAAARRSAAEAALQSIVQLARWACEPLQGRYPTQQIAEEQEGLAAGLLRMAAGLEADKCSSGGGSGGSSLCAAAVATAGSVQLQRCAAALSDLLLPAALRQCSLWMAWQLASVARVLLCATGCSGPSSSGSFPVTLACLRSRQGQRLLKTRVAAPAGLLTVVAVWFDPKLEESYFKLLPTEVRGWWAEVYCQ
jgi:hypothetical protein